MAAVFRVDMDAECGCVDVVTRDNSGEIPEVNTELGATRAGMEEENHISLYFWGRRSPDYHTSFLSLQSSRLVVVRSGPRT